MIFPEQTLEIQSFCIRVKAVDFTLQGRDYVPQNLECEDGVGMPKGGLAMF